MRTALGTRLGLAPVALGLLAPVCAPAGARAATAALPGLAAATFPTAQTAGRMGTGTALPALAATATAALPGLAATADPGLAATADATAATLPTAQTAGRTGTALLGTGLTTAGSGALANPTGALTGTAATAAPGSTGKIGETAI